MSTAQDKADGCELPESLRRYYLDTMGIQLWQELSTEAETVDAALTINPMTGNVVQKNALENKSTEIKNQFDISLSSWSEMQTVVQQCNQCGLQSSRSQVIFGFGDPKASLMIVCESPNPAEDIQAEPFVGEEGELMMAMLKAIKLKKEDVYISNIIKCLTPDNRKPSSQEINNCDAYLRRQIELVQPKVIYAAGAMAAHALLDTDESISLLRERQHDFNGIPLIASFHPGYLLRKPSEKRKAWQDLLQVKRLLAV